MNISTKEWEIMHLLWENAPQTITQLTKALEMQEGWSKHIVITYLKRLEEKNAVYFKEGGRAKLFYPNITQAEAERKEIHSFLDKVFSGNAGLLVNTMVKDEMLTEEDVYQLYQLLHGGKDD